MKFVHLGLSSDISISAQIQPVPGISRSRVFHWDSTTTGRSDIPVVSELENPEDINPIAKEHIGHRKRNLKSCKSSNRYLLLLSFASLSTMSSPCSLGANQGPSTDHSPSQLQAHPHLKPITNKFTLFTHGSLLSLLVKYASNVSAFNEGE